MLVLVVVVVSVHLLCCVQPVDYLTSLGAGHMLRPVNNINMFIIARLADVRGSACVLQAGCHQCCGTTTTSPRAVHHFAALPHASTAMWRPSCTRAPVLSTVCTYSDTHPFVTPPPPITDAATRRVRLSDSWIEFACRYIT